MHTYFVTGTDTDVGKTECAVLLLNELNKISDHTLGIKPISAGCENTEFGLRNSDALKLQKASSIDVDYDIINPIAYKEAIAPHIAATIHNDKIDLNRLQDCLDKAKETQPDRLLVEGAGGWRLPLDNRGNFLSDFALQNQMRVILVVGMRLGCLNHAVLTHQAIVADGLNCIGWVANQLSSDMPFYQENLDCLHSLLDCPLLAEVPFQPTGVNKIHLTDRFSEVFA